MAGERRIVGHCPLGCGKTLFVGSGGHITCSYIPCPRPTAVDELLADNETGHIVEFGDRTFTVRHPLRERLDDALMQCQLFDHIRDLSGPPVTPGRYRAVPHEAAAGGWSWQALHPRMRPPFGGANLHTGIEVPD